MKPNKQLIWKYFWQKENEKMKNKKKKLTHVSILGIGLTLVYWGMWIGALLYSVHNLISSYGGNWEASSFWGLITLLFITKINLLEVWQRFS